MYTVFTVKLNNRTKESNKHGVILCLLGFLFFHGGVKMVFDERYKEGNVRIPSGCAISGIFHKDGRKTDGRDIITSIEVMHERSNGLGGGFAAYGIYPEYKDYYAFHVFFDDNIVRKECESFLDTHFDVIDYGIIPTRKIDKITNEPLIYRYFLFPKESKLKSSQLDEKEFVVKSVMNINTNMNGCYVFSSGKNMGSFKAVGYPEDVGEFYKLDDYKAYSWTAHGRYPTNTPGWWGGAHPFSLLDYSIVHNGEISSYDANRRFIEMFGYKCNLLTDTEVITYMMDYLLRKKGLTLEESAEVIAAPFWDTIEKKDEEEKKRLTYLRTMFSSMLITGPFSIMLGFDGGIMALNDRLKLRSMVVGEKGEDVYIASEESAIKIVQKDFDNIYSPAGGQAVIVKLNEGVE